MTGLKRDELGPGINTNDTEDRTEVLDAPGNGVPVLVETPIYFESDQDPFAPDHALGSRSPTPDGFTADQIMPMSSLPVTRAKKNRPTLMSLGRDKLRYSWQSVKEDEPTRPRIHIIKLVSDTTSSSAGFPGGEAFRFSFSPSGRRIAVYNSARLYVLETAALPVGVSQDYALKRKPIAVEILDRCTTMAVLADAHTVNIYGFEGPALQRIRTIKLDFPSSAIALEPSGGLLAVAYDGGVEVFSLDPDALPTDRRAVRCQKMDKVAFSDDGTTLLATTTRINASATLVISVPIFPAAEDGVVTHQELKEAWCTSLLHPEIIRNTSHAVFFRQGKRLCNDRLFAWNGGADTFGLLHVENVQYGNIEFPVIISPPLSTCGGLGAAIHSCPSVDEAGDTVAMIVNDHTIRLYIVPHVAEEDPDIVEAHSVDHELDEGYGCPFTEVRWVHNSDSAPSSLPFRQSNLSGRLVVASPGGVMNHERQFDDALDGDIEGGRIIMFDFDPQLACQPSQTFVLPLGRGPPQVLEEAPLDVATEVAIMRRRTVNQSKSGTFSQRPLPLGRSATQLGRSRTRRSGSPREIVSSARSRGGMMSIQTNNALSRPSLELADSIEGTDVMDEPYVQSAPRSGAALQRAATNAQRHRFQAIEERDHERSGEGMDVETNGHVLPLPEYTPEPNAPLPSRFRTMAGLDPSPQPSSNILYAINVTGGHNNNLSRTEVHRSNPALPALITERIDEEFEDYHQPSPTSPLSDDGAPAPSPQSDMRKHNNNSDDSDLETPSRPLSRTGTFESGPLPRSLQRAYNAAASAGLPLPPDSDVDNVHPSVANVMRNSLPVRDGEAEGSGSEPISPVGETYMFGRRSVSANNLLNKASRRSSVHNHPTRSDLSGPSNAAPKINGIAESVRPSAASEGGNAIDNSGSLFSSLDDAPAPRPATSVGSVGHPLSAWRAPHASKLGSETRPSTNSLEHTAQFQSDPRSGSADLTNATPRDKHKFQHRLKKGSKDAPPLPTPEEGGRKRTKCTIM